jgi:hypothetical protein
MLIIHIFPLVLGYLWLCRKIMQKYKKIKQIEAIGARRATIGHLVGLAGPTMPPAGVAPSMPPH